MKLLLVVLLAFISQIYGLLHHRIIKPRANDYTDCCGIDKSTINPKIHSACKEPSSDFASAIPVNSSAILAIHQACRNGVSPPAEAMAPLVWDDTLACIAQQRAAQCEENHDKYNQRELPSVYTIGVGQNLGAGDMTFEEVAQAWCDEKSNWEYGVGKKVDDPAKMIGHFTQMVWAKTTAVGCGAAQCTTGDNKVYFCNYGPAGNVKMNGIDPSKYPYQKA